MKHTVSFIIYRGILALSLLTLISCAQAPTVTEPNPSTTPVAVHTDTLAPSAATSTIFYNTPTPTVTPVQPAYVTAFCTLISKDKKTYVSPDAPVTLLWGWDAKTEVQINNFLENTITTSTLDGIIITTMEKSTTRKNPGGLYEVVWSSEVGILGSGQHIILYDVKWKKMIEDGTSTYRPGGKIETKHDECEIM